MDHWRKSATRYAALPALHDLPDEVCIDASVLVRLDGTIGSWGREAQGMFGCWPEQVLGLPFSSLFVAECRHAVEALARAAPSEPRHVMATAVDKDGTHFDAEVTSTRTLGVRDGGTGLVELVRDVSQARAVEACLVACSSGGDCGSVVAGLGEALRQWIPGADLTLRVNGANGRSGEPKAGTVRLPLVADGRPFAMLDVRFADTAMVTPRTTRLLASVAAAIGAALSRALEFDQKSRMIGRLERLDRREKEFLALITHDMRTPLAVIAGFASSLRENWDELPDHERLDGLDAILRNGRSLTRLVEQDLQVALLESGELSCEGAPFDLGDQVERIVDEFARTADAQFEVWMVKPLAPAHGDEHRNGQVLANLLSNAVKFSAPGALVEVEVVERGAMVHVTVRDAGPGISAADMRKLFRKFARVGGADVRAVNGTGLGLYLSKRLVELQGGRIWVDSHPGQGSAFTYTLPLAVRPAAR
jgi:PAS domain S-box-containing protein